MRASSEEISCLEQLYEGRTPFYGELHDHAMTGGTSDGKRPLSHWLGALEALHMDFAAILDHKQVRHMFEPEWQDGTFIGGTEPAAWITDIDAERGNLHYNMVFATPEPLMELLEEFPEYQYTGGQEGHFIYPSFTTARFCELIDTVKSKGGFFVHPHPKQQLISNNPLHYWYRNETGLEVFYTGNANYETFTRDNYRLWTELLSMGKRLWACAGGDEHRCANNKALTTIYAEEKSNASYLSHLRAGDFTCGSVGIRMCVGDTLTGGLCSFAGQKLLVAAGDFHSSVKISGHTYRLDIINDTGVVLSEKITAEETAYFALDAGDCRFWRAEVWDNDRGIRIAVGNPIWNTEA